MLYLRKLGAVIDLLMPLIIFFWIMILFVSAIFYVKWLLFILLFLGIALILYSILSGICQIIKDIIITWKKTK